ncbi:hypothetical protein ACMFMG_001422 [Clarireedia jacksonii]
MSMTAPSLSVPDHTSSSLLPRMLAMQLASRSPLKVESPNTEVRHECTTRMYEGQSPRLSIIDPRLLQYRYGQYPVSSIQAPIHSVPLAPKYMNIWARFGPIN